MKLNIDYIGQYWIGSSLFERCITLFATWFFTGLIPPPPFIGGMAGTYGSLAAIPLCWVVLTYITSKLLYLVLPACILLLGIVFIEAAEDIIGPQYDWRREVKARDQNQIVIDEVLGMLITYYPLMWLKPQSMPLALGLGFALFRMFDIIKVPPTRFFDRMENSFGVMFDDVIAGIYAAICLTVAMLVLHI